MSERKQHLIIALPFEGSSLEAEFLEFGKDEEEAEKNFKMTH